MATMKDIANLVGVSLTTVSNVVHGNYDRVSPQTVQRILDAIEQLKETTQLIVISHQRRTMEQADVLYGVSMQADGVSHVVSQRLDRATGKVVDA